MTRFYFILLIITALNILRISAAIFSINYDESETTTEIFDPEISTATLSCWIYASEFMCKLDKNITGREIVEVDSVNAIRTLKNLKETKFISMSRDKVVMETMPQKFGINFVNLENFIAMQVGLKSLQRTDFGDMKKLKLLNLGNNELTHIPHDAFHELKDLEVIFLDENKIRSLNVAIFVHSTSLKRVFLSNNQLERLDDIFDRNFQIEEIYLNDNFLKNVNIDFRRLSQLKVVDLKRNPEICVTCESIKKVEDSSYDICDYEKANYAKINRETFEDCVLEKIQKLNKSKPALENCANNFKIAQKLNLDKFQTHTKVDDKNYLPSLIKQFDRFIFIKLHNESKISEKFDSCVSEEIFKDFDVDNMMKNCTDTKRIESEKIEDFYTKCTYCRPSRIENEMKKCNLQFRNTNAQSIYDFQAKVEELFRD